MKGAQEVCKNRVRTLREDLEQLRKTEEVYLRCHDTNLLDHKNKVREVFLTPMNVGLKVGMIDLAKQGGVLHRKYQYAPPPSSTGMPMPTLAFTRLRELVKKGTGSILTELQMFRKQAPENAASKRK